jgi:hypothetical protein
MRSVPNPRVQKYRDEAQRIRRAAFQMKDPEAQRQLLEVAQQYDKLAAGVERRGLE